MFTGLYGPMAWGVFTEFIGFRQNPPLNCFDTLSPSLAQDTGGQGFQVSQING